MATSGHNLLREAADGFYASLLPAERAALGSPSPTSVVDLTSEINRVKSRKGLRKLGERFLPLLKQVHQFSGVVDTLIQSNPVLSALIWGGLKALIMVALRTLEYFEKISEMFLRLGVLCPPLEEFRKLFPEPRLQDALCRFFAVVVKFCTSTITFLRPKGAMGIIKTGWKAFKASFEETEKELALQRENVDLNIVLAAELEHQRERERADVARQVADQHRQFEIEEWKASSRWRLQQDMKRKFMRREVLLSRVTIYNYYESYSRLRCRRHEGTGEWVFKSQPYVDWLKSCTVLWCHGIPGSGKSILTTKIVDGLVPTKPGAVAYYFCDYQNQQSLKWPTILRCILKQILSSLPPTEDRILSRFENPVSDDSLTEMILEAATHRSGKTYVLIDGIDECGPEDRHAVLTAVSRMVRQGDGFSVFLASRQEIEISRRLGSVTGCLELPLSENMNVDIEMFIEMELERRSAEWRFVADDSIKELIKTSLADGADGMILWVNFQLDEVCRAVTEQDIHNVLRTLPRGLNETYQRILRRIHSERKAEAALLMFDWLSIARRQLKLEELAEGIAFRLGDTRRSHGRFPLDPVGMLDNCCNLVILERRDGGRFVSFAHYTVLEYLRNIEVVDDVSSNNTVGRICLTYLNLTDFDTMIDRSLAKSCVQPPAQWMPTILGGAESNSKTKAWSLVAKMRGLGNQKLAPINIRTIFFPEDKNKQVARQLYPSFQLLSYVISHWVHHCQYLQSKLDAWRLFSDMVFNKKLPFEHRPWEGVSSLALDGVTDDGCKFWDMYQYAFQQCNWALVSCIHDFVNYSTWRGLVYRNIKTGDPSTKPLCIGSSLQIVYDDEKHQLRGLYRTRDKELALYKAVMEEDLEGIRCMLCDDVDVNSGTAEMTALAMAIDKGCLEIVKELAYAGADPDGISQDGRTCLQIAMSRLNMDIVQVLLSVGVRIDEAAVVAAIQLGNISILEAYLEARPVPEIPKDFYSPTTKSSQKQKEHFRLINLLDRLREEFTRPLHATVKFKRADMLKLMLRHGVNANLPNADDRGALGESVRQGNDEMVGLLLQYGADPCRALLEVVADGDLDSSFTLLEYIKDDDLKRGRCDGVLCSAVELYSTELVSKLLEKGANPDAKGFALELSRKDWTPLRAAEDCHAFSIVDILIKIGATRSNRQGPLEIAFRAWNSKRVKSLLENPNYHDKRTLSAALLAALLVGDMDSQVRLLTRDGSLHFKWFNDRSTIQIYRDICTETGTARWESIDPLLRLLSSGDLNK